MTRNCPKCENKTLTNIGRDAGRCPNCHGVLFELPGAPAPRFRCRVGHAWSPETLLDEQAEALESALWIALRALQEKAALSRRMDAGKNGSFRRMAEDADTAAATLRELIGRLGAAGGQ